MLLVRTVLLSSTRTCPYRTLQYYGLVLRGHLGYLYPSKWPLTGYPILRNTFDVYNVIIPQNLTTEVRDLDHMVKMGICPIWRFLDYLCFRKFWTPFRRRNPVLKFQFQNVRIPITGSNQESAPRMTLPSWSNQSHSTSSVPIGYRTCRGRGRHVVVSFLTSYRMSWLLT